MKDRIDYIDTAKGIGIILVVWLHMGSIGKLPYFIDWGGVYHNFLYDSVLCYERDVFQTDSYEEKGV